MEKEMATHSSVPAWKILESYGVTKSQTQLSRSMWLMLVNEIKQVKKERIVHFGVMKNYITDFLVCSLFDPF